ncbi:aquaporin-like protein [Aaosphaeria arxii CBS 175.79]|uniref:Aquaporin-like protein n=1 Tax=Aaosphaeria arxii CBS 175.79 TaxID=1450172 RepID=A0A6A5XU64_9PLEO|nr:aquaporin-like protein [Aaosphaeria arxii CBS 175.79]KAF2016459.1 aquaporin-like protein [Aaosphaeria arxii CBS 175.79]
MHFENMGTATTQDVELADSSASQELHKRRKGIMQEPSVSSRPFVGRIGGNQEFTLPRNDSHYSTIAEKVPDVSGTFTWRDSFRLIAFADGELWKEATLEGVGTCLQIFLSGLFSIGLGPGSSFASASTPLTAAGFAGVLNALLISFFIFVGGPVSGGHFNPFITLSTFFARLSIFPRTVLYVIFQCTGAVVAGFMLRAAIGSKQAFGMIPGCYIDTSIITPGQAYVFETMTSFGLIFIAFGVGLDPRQRQVFGPAVSSLLVGMALGFTSFVSGIARPGYTGASLNPARCLGLMSAADQFNYHYIHWFGDLTAAIINGIMYWIIPIYKD